MPQTPYNALIGTAYAHINTAATTVVKSAPGTLASIVVNTQVAGTVTIYDNATAASGTVVAVITVTATFPTLPLVYNLKFANGLTIVTSGTADLTVVFI